MLHTVKALLSPRGLISFWTLQRGLITEGGLLERGLIQKLDEEDIYDSFILLPHILRFQDAILRIKYLNSAEFYPKL